MAVTCGLLVVLDAKEGKGAELGTFLEAGRDIAAAEQGTVTWYAFKMNETTFGVFDTFASEDARQAHLDGEIPKALAQVGPDLLAKEPDIRRVDLVAVK